MKRHGTKHRILTTLMTEEIKGQMDLHIVYAVCIVFSSGDVHGILKKTQVLWNL